MYKILFLLIPLTFVFTTCKQDDITPSWIEIDAINLSTDEVSQGENSHKIVDAWLYLDGTALGVFELPARIPILADGQHDITILAGIINNGISGTRTIYPFYQGYDTTIVLTKNATHKINPLVEYKTNTRFEMIEDFEGVGIEFVKDPFSDTTIVIYDIATYPEIVNWGNNCGAIFLDGVDSVYKGITATFLDLPKNEDVYMEIDYMNTNSIAMGVSADYGTAGVNEHTPLILFNPQKEEDIVWKKLYIDLKEDVSFEVNALSYEIYLLAIKDPELSSGYIYIDNIKIVRFQ